VKSENKILILGLGSEILTDDGIGSKIVNDLESRNDFMEADFATALLGGWELLDIIKDYDELLVIDGIRSGNGKAGDLYMYSMEDFKETLHLSNVHETGFSDTLALGRKIGMKMPGRIKIFAIEVEEDLVFSSNLSPTLCDRYENIVSIIHNSRESLMVNNQENVVLN